MSANWEDCLTVGSCYSDMRMEITTVLFNSQLKGRDGRAEVLAVRTFMTEASSLMIKQDVFEQHHVNLSAQFEAQLLLAV